MRVAAGEGKTGRIDERDVVLAFEAEARDDLATSAPPPSSDPRHQS
jgi:hypothetical protein